MEKLNKYRYYLWAAAALLMLWYCGPSLTSSMSHPSPATVIQKPNAGIAAPPASTVAAAGTPNPGRVTNPTPVAAANASMAGTWRGGSVEAERGNCVANLEVTPAEAVNRYNGYVTVKCQPVVLPTLGKAAVQTNQAVIAFTPVSAIMSGAFTGNGIDFQIDKSIAQGCTISALTLTNFGTGTLAMQWKDSCGGGEMLLRR